MTDVITRSPRMSPAHDQKPPSSAPSSPGNSSLSTCPQQSVGYPGRKLRHSKAPLFSPDYTIPRTSLYRYPSDCSLTSVYTDQSPSKLAEDQRRMFTAVIPPLAAVPPTEPLPPLPPTPPAQGITEQADTLDLLVYRSLDSEPCEILGSHRGWRTQKKGGIEVRVKIVKDVHPEIDTEKQKKRLRRMKGNIGDVANIHVHRSTTPEARSTTPEARTPPRNTVPALSADSGLPTPGPTPPSSARIITPPRTLHHPKPYMLPLRRLDYNRSNRNSMCSDTSHSATYAEDEDDDDDGGIAIAYEDEISEDKETRLQVHTVSQGRLNPFGMDIPRPDSPFVTGFAVRFDDHVEQQEEVDAEANLESPTQYGYGSEDEGVRLSACRKSFTEFYHTPPKRIDPDKAEVVEGEAEQLGVPTAVEEQKLQPTVSVTEVAVPASESIRNKSEPLLNEKTKIHNSLGEVSGEMGSKIPAYDAKSRLPGVDLCISRSSILQRRHHCPPTTTDEKIQGLSTALLPPPYSSNTSTKSSFQTTSAPEDGNRGATKIPTTVFSPPQLPRFNFIPATPLPLMSPSTLLEKQLGEHSLALVGPSTSAPIPNETAADDNTSSTSTLGITATATKTPTRPSLSSHSKPFRDSRLHPWWRPRSYPVAKEAYLATLLEGTTFTGTPGSKFTEKDWGSSIPLSPSPSATSTQWIEYGPVRVDKKRKLVGLGGVQIQWVGLGGWVDRLVGAGGKQEDSTGGHGEEKEKGKEKEKEKENGGEREQVRNVRNVNLKRKGWIDW